MHRNPAAKNGTHSLLQAAVVHNTAHGAHSMPGWKNPPVLWWRKALHWVLSRISTVCASRARLLRLLPLCVQWNYGILSCTAPRWQHQMRADDTCAEADDTSRRLLLKTFRHSQTLSAPSGFCWNYKVSTMKVLCNINDALIQSNTLTVLLRLHASFFIFYAFHVLYNFKCYNLGKFKVVGSLFIYWRCLHTIFV